MKFKLIINDRHREDKGKEIEEIEDINGHHTLNELIAQIALQTFNEEFLRLYSEKDIDREYDLTQYWTKEQRALTLYEHGFQDGVEYQIDADNYPEASLSPVTIGTDKTWYIIKSGSYGPILKVVPNMPKFRIDFNSWRAYLPGQRTKSLKVLVEPKVIPDKNGKIPDKNVPLEPGKYTLRKFKFHEKFEDLHLDFEPGTKIPRLKIGETGEFVQGEDIEFTFPLLDAPEPLSKMKHDLGPKAASNAAAAFGFIVPVIDFFLAASGM